MDPWAIPLPQLLGSSVQPLSSEAFVILCGSKMFKGIIGAFLVSLPWADATCLADNKEKLKTCGSECMDSKDRVICVSDCLQKQDVVAVCADCLGSEFDCGSRFCAAACEGEKANGRSASCQSCLQSQCRVCSSELDFQANTNSNSLDSDLAEAVEPATPPADGETDDVKSLAALAGSCASSGALIDSCGTPCYSSADPSGCYATCAMKACFSGCYECSTAHCFGSCRRSFASYECATCVSGFCGGCTVQMQAKEASTMFP